MATKKMIMDAIEKIAESEDTPVNHRLKALELLGKSKGLFGKDEQSVSKVIIVDDVPKEDDS